MLDIWQHVTLELSTCIKLKQYMNSRKDATKGVCRLPFVLTSLLPMERIFCMLPFMAEVWFHPFGYVNSQNSCIYSAAIVRFVRHHIIIIRKLVCAAPYYYIVLSVLCFFMRPSTHEKTLLWSDTLSVHWTDKWKWR